MDKILVVDFGGQYAHLISRRVRSLGVYTEIAVPTVSDFSGVKGIILSGGPNSVYDKDAPDYNKKILELDVPILGICYGMQIMAYQLGGKVRQLESKEYGKARIRITETSNIFEGLDEEQLVWMSHGDSIDELPQEFERTATTTNCPIAAMQRKNLFGIQFHPEVTHTKHGMKLLENFVKLCGIKRDWTTSHYLKDALQHITETVDDRHVLMAASGGVDSTVASVMLHRALGDSVYYVFVDTGLIRLYDVDDFKQAMEKEGIKNLFVINAEDEFLENLKGIREPEEKRKVISETFFRVFQRKAAELSKKYNIEFLGQGTIYPDRIETAEASGQATKIKSHHNVLLPDWLDLKIIEPLRDFYKDEVRELGKSLSMDMRAIRRHPFPGPGLGVRILGELTREKVKLYKELDLIVDKHIRASGWYDKLWMGFPVMVPVAEFGSAEEKDGVVGGAKIPGDLEQAKDIVRKHISDAEVYLLPVKSVGVMGDARTYQHPLCLHTAKLIKYDALEKASNEVVNKIKGINRVIWDVTSKPRGWDTLVVLRAITSTDAMTADWAKLEPELLHTIADEIMKHKEISRVVYDVTQKPPGTMEWE